MRPRPFRLRNLLVLLLVFVFVTAPWLDSTYRYHRLADDGVEVDAVVEAKQAQPYELVVEFHGDAGLAGLDAEWRDQVDRATWDDSVIGGTVPARVLASPEVHEVDGALRSDVPLVLLVLGDGGLLLVIAAMVVYRRRFRVPELWAVEDLRLIPVGGSLVRLGSTEYIVSGEVVLAEPDAVEIDTGGERVRLLLVGYDNPVEEHGHAQAVGRVPPGRMGS